MNQHNRPSTRSGVRPPSSVNRRPTPMTPSPSHPHRRRRRKKRPSLLIPVLLILILILALLLTVVLASHRGQDEPPDDATTTASGSTVESNQASSDPQITYTDVTLLSAGDIMFHYDNLQAGYDAASGTYSFLDMFQYLVPIVNRYDYAVANFETTLSGTAESYTQNGSSNFNSPDTVVDAIKSASFDMMLYANNHTYDRGIAGLKRTVQTLEANGLSCIGAVDDKQSKAWKIVDLNGTRIGMLNYTNEGLWSDSASGTLNGTTLKEDHGEYINVFYLNDLEGFYSRVAQDLSDVREAGADLIVFYIHWGPEYYTEPRENTKQIAQTLCDMGVDVILGSHPHVIQPMETLTSASDPKHKTVCFYSLGNFLSNQNRETLSESYCKGNNKNTENGLMVVLTIRKYSTGQTLVVGIETIPTWVHRYSDDSGRLDYRIIPLAPATVSPDEFGLNDSSFGLEHAKNALAMTTDMIDSAVAAFNQSVVLPEETGAAAS